MWRWRPKLFLSDLLNKISILLLILLIKCSLTLKHQLLGVTHQNELRRTGNLQPTHRSLGERLDEWCWWATNANLSEEFCPGIRYQRCNAFCLQLIQSNAETYAGYTIPCLSCQSTGLKNRLSSNFQHQVFVRLTINFLLKGLPCKTIKAPPNGHMTCSGLVTNETCLFSCNDGYDLQGSERRTCLNSAEWDGDETFCKGEQRRSLCETHL